MMDEITNAQSTIKERIPESKRLLDVEEVSVYLKVSKSFIYKLIHRRQIPFVKISNLVRFRMEDLTVFIEKNLSSRDTIVKKAHKLLTKI